MLAEGKVEAAELDDAKPELRCYVRDWAKAVKNGSINEEGEVGSGAVAAKRRKLSGEGGRVEDGCPRRGAELSSARWILVGGSWGGRRFVDRGRVCGVCV